ncbi:MAG TPA: S41 family peptidase [Gemmatimonadaceae bacterium]|nr:S41 family peptidase [Gemmatimonadaceae bacterium]
MRSRAVIVTAVFGAALVTGGWLLQRGLDDGASRLGGARLLHQVMAHVQEHYVDSVSGETLYRLATEGLLTELGDPHSVYLPPERLARLNETTSRQYGGLGVNIDVRDGWIVVIASLPGSPAERAGIRTGDRIVRIDSAGTHDFTPDEAQRALRGAPGSSVRLVVETPGSSEPRTVSVRREQIRVSAVQRASVLRDGVGYVDVNVFGDSTTPELVRAVDSLRAAGMRTLIIDLRRNPGGLLAQGVAVADLFLGRGDTVLTTRGRTADANATYADETAQRWRDMPVVVLVDQGSASSAEIVAGALQDHDRALVVGRTTFGKGSAQSVIPTSGGGALKLTTARWFTPLGRAIGRAPGDTLEDEEADVSDEEGLELPPPGGRPRPRFTTPGGRTVYGGGGITPDVVTGDTAIPPAELALQQALGGDVAKFRDAMTDFALQVKAQGIITSPDFEVTPAIRDAFYQRLVQRGLGVDRAVYDGAEPLVARLLGVEITRYVFGRAAEFRRVAAGDPTIQTALSVAAGARSQRELFERAARLRVPPTATARR